MKVLALASTWKGMSILFNEFIQAMLIYTVQTMSGLKKYI